MLETMLDAHSQIWGMGEDSVFNGNISSFRDRLVAAGNQGAPPYSLYVVLCFVVFLYLTNSVVHLYACISSFKFILNYRFGDSAKPDVLLLSLDREPLFCC